jgi:hypothetical protein
VDVPAAVTLDQHLVVQGVGVAAHRRVHRRKVVALHEVVAVGLPVARDVANGTAVEPERLEVDVGDLLREGPQPLVQRRHVHVEAHEHHAAPGLDLDPREVHVAGELAAEVAGVEQTAVVAERPPVVSADEVGLMTFAVPHDRAGAMRTQVVEGDQLAILVAANEDRPAGEVLGHVVTGATQLVLVGDMHPRGPEYRPSLAFENGRIRVPARWERLHQFHGRETSHRFPKGRRVTA